MKLNSNTVTIDGETRSFLTINDAVVAWWRAMSEKHGKITHVTAPKGVFCQYHFEDGATAIQSAPDKGELCLS